MGLISYQLKEKAIPVGNSALGGSEAFLFVENAEEKLDQLLDKTMEVSLAANKFFQDYFIEARYFEEEEILP